jgi:hypothetical protein
MTSEEIRAALLNIEHGAEMGESVPPYMFGIWECAFQLARIFEKLDSLVTSEAGKGDAVSEGRTGPEYQIRDVLDGLNRIDNIAAAARFRSDPEYPATLERIREVVGRIRALEVGKYADTVERAAAVSEGGEIRCSDCHERLGSYHKPSCHRQGTVTEGSDYRDRPIKGATGNG